MAAKEAAQEAAEETRVPQSLKEGLQALFDAGAIFNFGQPRAVPKPGRKPKEDVQTQPTLQHCTVVHVHDGGNWFGVTLQDGRRCRTTDAERLRKLIQHPQNGNVGVHFHPL